MLIKGSVKGGKREVTFELPAEVTDGVVHLCGEFNDWSRSSLPMNRTESGFQATVLLESGRQYRYRYLIDNTRWENDWQADAYVPNEFGGEDSAVNL